MKRLVATCLAMAALLATAAADDLTLREQKAFQTAVDRVAPSVVRIETIGGGERVDKVLLGNGPTTGLVVDPSGLIVSSAFEFLRRPDSILVQLPDGTRRPARLVATDTARMLVLLAIESQTPLAAAEMAPRDQTRVGQWAIAVGRTFEGNEPNMSVGIVSALSRIRGRALQTDAATSPANYGGPLLDVHGRVLGVLTPLSPTAGEKTGRIEWYDSGIGFAVPADDVMRAVARLRGGEDLHPGRLGIVFAGGEPSTAEPVVAGCHPNSPAYGRVYPEDRVTAVDDVSVGRAAEVTDALGRYYAGDRIKLSLLRDGRPHEEVLTLVVELPPYERPWLGILPRRGAPPAGGGVPVRYVYPDGPAARAGIESGDVLAAMAGEPLGGVDDLRRRIALLRPGDEVKLDVSRNGKTRSVEIRLDRLAEGLPEGRLPSPYEKPVTTAADGTARGKQTVRVPEVDNQAWAYVPPSQSAATPSGLVVWLDAPGAVDDDEILRLWKPICDRDNLILLAVKPSKADRWSPNEEEVVARLMEEAIARYAIDGDRVVVHGYQGGGRLAGLVAYRHRDLVRGLAVVDALLAGRVPEADPIGPLAFYVVTARKSSSAARTNRSIQTLREAKHPVEHQTPDDLPRYLTPEQVNRLAKWIDTLDRV